MGCQRIRVVTAFAIAIVFTLPAIAEQASRIEGTFRTLDADDARRAKNAGVAIGMTREDVLRSSWGKPLTINSTITSGGKREQWVYGGGGYLYLDNGIVTAVQTTSRLRRAH